MSNLLPGSGMYSEEETGLYLGAEQDDGSGGTRLVAKEGIVLNYDGKTYEDTDTGVKELRVAVDTKTDATHLRANSFSGIVTYDPAVVQLQQDQNDTGYIIAQPGVTVDTIVTQVRRDQGGNETGELRFSVDRTNTYFSDTVNNPLFELRLLPVDQGNAETTSTTLAMTQGRFLDLQYLEFSKNYAFYDGTDSGNPAVSVPLTVQADGSTTTTTTTTNGDGTTTTTETTQNPDGSTTTTTTVTNPDGSSTTTETVTDSNGNVVSQTTTTRDENGTVTQVIEETYDENGNLTNRTQTEYVYDENGVLVQETTTEYYVPEGTSPERVIVTDYNPDGTQTVTTTEYDQDGNITSTTVQEYDANGNLVQETITLPDGTVTNKVYNYSPEGYPDGYYTIDITTTDPNGNVTRTREVYDANGNLIDTIDLDNPNGGGGEGTPIAEPLVITSDDQQATATFSIGSVLDNDELSINTIPQASVSGLPELTLPITNGYTVAGQTAGGENIFALAGPMNMSILYSMSNVPPAPTGQMFSSVVLLKQQSTGTWTDITGAQSSGNISADVTSIGTFVVAAKYSAVPTGGSSGGSGGSSGGGGAAPAVYSGTGSGGGGTPDLTTPVILPATDNGKTIVAYGPLKFDLAKGVVNVPVRHLEYPLGYEVAYDKGTNVTEGGSPFLGTIYPLSKYSLDRLKEPMRSLVPDGYSLVSKYLMQYGDLTQEFNPSVTLKGTLQKPLDELVSDVNKVVILGWDDAEGAWKQIGDKSNFDGDTFSVKLARSMIVGVFEGTGNVLTNVDLSACGDITNNARTPFPDANTHWGVEYICKLQMLGAVSGYTAGPYAGLFKPDNNVTRAELVKIVLAATGVDVSQVTPIPVFSDLEPGQWYLPYVAKAKELGIIQGYEDGTFRPNSPVNRAEALKIILLASKHVTQADIDEARVNEAQDPDNIAVLPDVPESDWFAPYVSYAATHNIIGGKADGKFHAGDNMTRAEVSKVVTLTEGY